MVIFCADGHFYLFFSQKAQECTSLVKIYSHSLKDVLVDISIKGLIFDRQTKVRYMYKIMEYRVL